MKKLMPKRSVEHFISGKVKWFKPNELNPWGKRTHVMYPNKEGVELIQTLIERDGIKNSLKRDDEGYYLTLSTPNKVTWRGEEQLLPAPKVVDGTKTLPDGSHPAFDGKLGNGSEVTSKIQQYFYTERVTKKDGSAIRWLSSRIDNLIPYEPTKDGSSADQKQIEGLDTAPRPTW